MYAVHTYETQHTKHQHTLSTLSTNIHTIPAQPHQPPPPHTHTHTHTRTHTPQRQKHIHTRAQRQKHTHVGHTINQTARTNDIHCVMKIENYLELHRVRALVLLERELGVQVVSEMRDLLDLTDDGGVNGLLQSLAVVAEARFLNTHTHTHAEAHQEQVRKPGENTSDLNSSPHTAPFVA
jgi:hypothetical protein